MNDCELVSNTANETLTYTRIAAGLDNMPNLLVCKHIT